MNLRIACIALLIAAGTAGCAGHGSGSASVGFSYGAYYGSPWGASYHVNGPVYVGPPGNARPPGGSGRPPHAANLPARPMPQPRPSGGGRRR
ncbi:MAG TPA: hypothetical protein VN496_07340 [Burkholderiales bacterium]|nr:hypothetical protein [Burkholderiales bacterium]